MRIGKFGWFWLVGMHLFSCSSPEAVEVKQPVSDPYFKILSADSTGIYFNNSLQPTERLNAYTYRNFYNGAGVAIGDINNDGLLDLYFAGNQVSNKLYLNKGNFRFEDITEYAGVGCDNVWSTGVSMADVNGDGWLDIYVCKSGPPERPNRTNELFINNKNNTFSEKAEEYGINDKGLSNHAVFFDFDLDGDLDMYLLNNSLRSVGIYNLREGQRNIRDSEGGNKLYRNDGTRFTDVSESAGIYGSAIGFGLGVTAADVNRDGWPDIYVSNDFFERDYLYINQHDGTFKEMLTELITETSMGSMGADIADLTNDGYPEIYVTEMLPATLDRIKTKTVFEDWDKYQANVKSGYYHQFTRNVLQYNNGPTPDSKGNVSFSEVSRMTNTDATDWSWGALIFDINNDGFKDIFVSNGIYKDLTDHDFINFYSNTELKQVRLSEDSTLLTSLINKIPSVPLNNHLFINEGNLKFKNAINGSGLEGPGFSNGAAYADLDNDGDLDLVVNNVNQMASVYQNLTRDRDKGNSLQLVLQGGDLNTAAFGTQVMAYVNGTVISAEQQPVRGYMSTVDPRVHIGLGNNSFVDSLILIWPGHSRTVLKNVKANQLLRVEPENLSLNKGYFDSNPKSWAVAGRIAGLDTISHTENDFIDFNRDRLLFEMYSNEGPPAVVGDVTNDGLEDIIVGGASGYPIRVFSQQGDGSFLQILSRDFEIDKESEDVHIHLVDVDQDDALDIVVASGGNEFGFGDNRWIDRLYLNQGNGQFSKSNNFISNLNSRTSTAFYYSLDFDGDGDQDLLMGRRLEPFIYGKPVSGELLQNNGKGIFTSVTDQFAPGLIDIGMLTDAEVLPKGAGGRPEFIIVGEWMQPVRFYWDGAQYNHSKISAPKGLYKTIHSADLNNDGNVDLILGNYGTNTRFNVTIDKPLTMFIGDYDKNGSIDHITSMYEGDSLYPLVMLQDLTKQMPGIRKKYQTFDKYKNATINEVVDTTRTEFKLTVNSLETGVLIGVGDGIFNWNPLPKEAQMAPVHAIYTSDINADGSVEIILAGNQTRAKPELGIYNASYGLVLSTSGNSYKPIPHYRSGIWVRGDVREITSLRVGTDNYLLFFRNNLKLKCFKVQ